MAPAILTVNSLADNTTDTSALNLREAITLVNNGGNPASLGQSSMPAGWQSQISGSFGDNDTIQFDAGLSGGTITLGSNLPALSSNMTIAGLGAGNLAISGAGQYQVFHATGTETASISGLTIEDGAGQGGVTTVLGDSGTTLYLNGDSLDASASLTADTAVFSGNNSVAGSYQASGATEVLGGTTTLTGTVSSLGAYVALGFSGPGGNSILDLSAASLPAAGLTISSLSMVATSSVKAAGAITVTQGLASGGNDSLLGGGTLTLAQGSTSSIFESTFTTDDSVVNEGTLTIGPGDLELAAGQTFTNTSTGTVQMEGGNATLGDDASWTFINQGALVATTGSDTVNATFVNQATGTVHVQSGAQQLYFSGGGSIAGTTGTTTVLGDAGTTLGFNNFSFDASSSVVADLVVFNGNNSVAGSYQASSGTEVQSGSTTFSGTVSSLGAYLDIGIGGGSSATLDLSAASLPAGPLTFTDVFFHGTLIAPAAVTVTGNLYWYEDNHLLGGNLLTLDGTSTVDGSFTTAGSVVNNGTLTLGPGRWVQLAAGQTFTNTSTGTVQMEGGNGALGDASWTFINQGALVEAPDPNYPSGNGPAEIVGAVFDNQSTGTVHVQANADPLDFSGGGTVSGQSGVTTVLGDAGTTLGFNNLSSDASASLTADTAVFDGNNSMAGSYQANGSTQVQGTTTLTGTVNSLGTYVYLGVNSTLDLSAASLPAGGLTFKTLNTHGTLKSPAAITVTGTFDSSNSNLQGGGTLTLAQGSTSSGSFTAAGSVVNAGTLTLGPGGTVQLAAGQTFTNTSSGTVQMEGGRAELGVNASSTFINQGALVEAADPNSPYGNGTADIVSAVFDNQATGTVHVQAGAQPLDFTGGGSVAGTAGVATMLGDAGTTLGFNNLSFDASTSIQADTVVFSGSNSVAGSYQASGSTQVPGGTTTLTGTVSRLGTYVYLGGNSTLDLSAASLPAAGLTFSDLTLAVNSILKAPVAITVTGTFYSSNANLLGGGTLTLAQGSTTTIDGSFITAGSVVNASGVIVGPGRYIELAAGQTFTNTSSGTVQMEGDNGTLGDASWTFINQGTLVEAADPNNPSGNGPAAIVGAVFVNQATGTVYVQAGKVQADPLDFTGGGSVSGQSGVTTVLGGYGTTLGFNGLSFAASSSIVADTVYFNGSNSVAGSYQAASGTEVGGGTTTFQGAPSGATLQLGNLTIDSGGWLNINEAVPGLTAATVNGVLAVNAGGVLGSGGSTVTINAGGYIGGDGTVNDNIALYGTIVPGYSDGGTFTVNGNVTELAGSNTWEWLAGTTPGAGSPRLVVSGQSTLDSTLTIYLENGFLPAHGESFTMQPAGSGTISGAFVGLPQGTVFVQDNAQWQISYQGGSGHDVVLSFLDWLTSTGVTASANPSVFGQPVSFTATVSNDHAGGPTPTGSVQFQINGSNFGSPVALNSSGQATSAAISSLAAGSYTVTAVYTNTDLNFSGSSGSLTQTVNPDATSTAVSSSANPASVGAPITLTATVTAQSPGAGTPTGSVTFYDGATALGTATLQVVNGVAQASFTTSALGLGNHSITAAYSGDLNFTFSTSPVFTQQVHKATTTSLTAPTSSVWGQSITLKATVKAKGAGTPSGTVTFMDGSTVLGTGTLQVVGGVAQASLTVSNLAIGSHSLSAVYGGDTNFGISSSSPVSETVNQAQTKVALTASPTTAVWGQSVTFTAVVSAKAPGAGTPTGTVTFEDGGTPLGQQPVALQVVNGVDEAVFSTSALSVGSHSITAVYSGDGNFVTSTSAAVTETINKAKSTTGLSSSANPVPHGQPVTFTATVLPVSPGSGMPTGTVSFYDGSTLIGTVNLSNGVAQLTYTFATKGTHKIKAVYSGDSDFLSSTSAVLAETVT